MSQHKLIYFNARGKAEVIRLIFAAAGEKYEDFRFDKADWPNHKPNMPFGQVPVLEIHDGDQVTVLAQSTAICRFLANKFNLAGSSDLEKAKADMVVDQINDLLSHYSLYFYEQNEERKKELQDKLLTKVLPENIAYLEAVLTKWNTPFIAGNELTWADLAIVNAIDRIKDKKDIFLEKAPLLKALDDKVRALPKVAEWFEKRPVTEF